MAVARPTMEQPSATGRQPPLRLLVTGAPGTGKTTLCDSVYHELTKASCSVDGFLTHEQRDAKGRRIGFECVTLDASMRAPLATVGGRQTGCTVGRYSVQVEDFEGLALPILDRMLTSAGRPGVRAVVFDEIGKMEMFSSGFTSRVRRVLESPDAGLHVLGTVALSGGGFISQSKRLPGVELVEISAENRNAKTSEVAQRLLSALAAGQAGCSAQPEVPAAPIDAAATGHETSAPSRGGGGGRARAGGRRWQPKAQPVCGVAEEGLACPVPDPAGEAAAAPAAALSGTAATTPSGAGPAPGPLGQPVSFGKNAYGQLGRPSAAGSSGDVLGVCGVTGGPVTFASCGFDHSALIVGGRLLLFGRNNRGQCGQPSSGLRGDKDKLDPNEDIPLPALAAGLPPARAVSSVSCGGDHVIALLEGGEVWACGDNGKGQCALGTGAPKISAAFQRCARLGLASTVSAGYRHSAALCSGRLYVWGAGNQGQLGLGGRRDAPEPQHLDLSAAACLLALGRWHSLAATEQGVWAFGWGRFGVLGQGDFTDHRAPVRVEGLPGTAGGLHCLVSGAVHCGAVVGSERQVLVWGRGQLGRLGLGSEANALWPAPLPGLCGVDRLAMGGDFSAARTLDGTWHVWGKGEEGQLGLSDADRGKRLRPTRSQSLQGATFVTLGDCHALALT